MSTELAPIHFWMYQKIFLLEAQTQSILQLAETAGWNPQIAQETAGFCPAPEEKPLEEAVDLADIHGWIQNLVETVENRFAFAVTNLVSEDLERLDSMKQALYALGKGGADHQKITSLQEAFALFNSVCLHGMPCDNVLQIEDQHTGRLEIREAVSIHAAAWEQVNGDVNHYYTLRESFLQGLLSESKYDFHNMGDSRFALEKRRRKGLFSK